ncbi:hypothetical protein HUN01_03060 [Nostoc edaphicum CCNP1411]|uniref:Uncharacterized protein n=1 Tax=Nostoc edaphicum CCNP1411 TaxID=1472755 RepID=A0A7D7Q972_9NOSO|nr:hypothetical protein [Nostoc edaphicum]QMS86595.1 hypothetical protein HUN01_03060 [Nostoc edaphicum CCNP1411]
MGILDPERSQQEIDSVITAAVRRERGAVFLSLELPPDFFCKVSNFLATIFQTI